MLNKIIRFLKPHNDKFDDMSPSKLECGTRSTTPIEDDDDGYNNNNVICLEQIQRRVRSLRGIVLGRRASGKTNLANELLHMHLRRWTAARALVFHGTESIHPLYGREFGNNVDVHNRYSPRILDEFLRNHANIPKHFLMVVLDGCFDLGHSKDVQLESLAESAINTLFLADHPLEIPAGIRTKSNCLFLFKEHVFVYRKRMYENWKLSDVFASMDVFEHMYAKASDVRYGYLLVDLQEHACFVGRSLITDEGSDDRET